MLQHVEGPTTTVSVPDAIPNNLAPALTSFVGREQEIGAIGRLVEGVRLVSLTGPPGAGKTRVASEVARRVLHEFADGVWFVELAPISEPHLVLSAIADALDLRPGPDRPVMDTLIAHLGPTRRLLVLDNFEHVLEAADAIGALLLAAPNVHVLVTSRVLLHLSGEQEFALPPLALPERDSTAAEQARSEAVELFARRATNSLSAFRLDQENTPQVAELCHQLDGLPLAIELAAARVKLLPVEAILSRVDHRLVLLTGGPRDTAPRHRSVRAAIAWSYDLLEISEQALFRRLAAFRGGWTIGAAAAIWDEPSDQAGVLDTLGGLLDASLLVRQASDRVPPRFTMLETLREFATERLDDLGETDDAKARHAAYYRDFVEREKVNFLGSDPGSGLDRVAIEHDNVRAALAYLVSEQPEAALGLAAGMWRFWQMRGYLIEGDRWLTEASEAAGDSAPEVLRAEASTALGGLAYWRGDIAGARPYYERALAIRRNLGDQAAIANALYDLAFVFAPHFFPPPEDRERTEAGRQLVAEAEALYQRLGDEAGLAKSGWMLGILALYADLDDAKDRLAVTVERFRHLDDPFGLGWALRMYGCALLGTTGSTAAAAVFREALQLFSAASDGSAFGLLLNDLADVATFDGDAIRAVRLKGAVAGLRQVTEAGLANVDAVPWMVNAPVLKQMIETVDFERAWAEGQAMSPAQATAYALGSDLVSGSDSALHVRALGPFLVERTGVPVAHWGGAKAGSRQAQAMFAFLLDRGDRGVAKDEFLEVIWPDADLDQGDLSFHRTLGGLRTTLRPPGSAGDVQAIAFGNGRYRLAAGVVGSYDIAEFEQRLLNAAQATDDVAAIRSIEAARTLYRGDYLDDCPLYGDSEYVEEHRRLLRGRLTDALVDLGHRYERRGDESLAAARFREALTVAGGDCASASEGLDRLGAPLA
jgi:predicted ATPase